MHVFIEFGIMYGTCMQKASCAKYSLAIIFNWGVIDYNSYLTVLSLVARLFIGLGTRLDSP